MAVFLEISHFPLNSPATSTILPPKQNKNQTPLTRVLSTCSVRLPELRGVCGGTKQTINNFKVSIKNPCSLTGLPTPPLGQSLGALLPTFQAPTLWSPHPPPQGVSYDDVTSSRPHPQGIPFLPKWLTKLFLN